jgi:L-amino acid N-acyltransferase YncA
MVDKKHYNIRRIYTYYVLHTLTMQLTYTVDVTKRLKTIKNIQIAFAPIFVTTAGGDLDFTLTNNLI